MRLCPLCRTHSATVPGRNVIGRPSIRICPSCHTAIFVNDSNRILDSYYRKFPAPRHIHLSSPNPDLSQVD